MEAKIQGKKGGSLASLPGSPSTGGTQERSWHCSACWRSSIPTHTPSQGTAPPWGSSFALRSSFSQSQILLSYHSTQLLPAVPPGPSIISVPHRRLCRSCRAQHCTVWDFITDNNSDFDLMLQAFKIKDEQYKVSFDPYPSG